MSEVTLLTNTIDQEKIKESLYNNASILVNAIKSNPSMGQGSIDIIHSGSSVFDKKKMSRFLKEGNGLVISTATTMEKIEGSNIKTYVKDFTNKFSASGNYKFSIAAAVSGSVTNDFDINVEQSVERKFSQVRNMARFATVTLPTVITREELRKLVSGSILAAIDDIKTLEDAQEFVSMIGVAYMEKAYLGGTLTMSSKSESSEYSSEVNLTSDIEAEMKVLGKGMNASNHFQMGRNAGFINKNLEVTIHAKGGDSAQILAGRKEEWYRSISSSLAVIDYKLAPISNLAEEGSIAEEHLTTIIKKICDTQSNKFVLYDPPSSLYTGTFTLRGLANAPQFRAYLNQNGSDQRNGGEILQWNYPQKWEIKVIREEADGPVVTIRSEISLFYLNINIGQQHNNGQVYQWNYKQQWKMREVEDNVYTFQSLESLLYLNVNIGEKYNGGKIVQWAYPQKWEVLRG